MKRIAVLTSGGDAPGMNAAVRAVVRAAIYYNMSVIGFKRGYNGPLLLSQDQSDDFTLLTSRSVSGIVHRGGTFLRTARCMKFLEEEYQIKAIENMHALGIDGLIGIGGDGTYHGLAALKEKGFPVIGIPGTIDKDMTYTDYTIGFDTAVNTACDSIDKIRDTSGSHERASLVTVMGRNCGEIAVNTALACGAEIVLIPEKKWSIEEVAERVRWGAINGKNSVIIVFAEGAFSSLTSDIEGICSKYENLKGITREDLSSSSIARIIAELSGHETKATVLGYVQRGGNPSAKDRIMAGKMGAYAVSLLQQDISGVAVGEKTGKLINVPVEEAMVREIGDYSLLTMLIEEMGAIDK